MTRRLNNTLFGLIILLLLVCCSSSKEGDAIDERIYATVNGVRLTESGLMSLVPEGVYEKLTVEYKQELIREWVNNELIYQEALKRNIDKDPKIAWLLNNSKRNLLSNELLERIYNDIVAPSDEVLKKYYKEHEDYFILSGNEYRIRYALFDNRKDAQDFWRAVKKGESFSELAKTDSKDPSFQTGGDIGIITEEMIEPAIWNAVENTYNKLGMVKISDPFSVMDGWSCLIVDEVYEKDTVRPFKIVRDQVLDMYLVEKREEARAAFIDELGIKAKIKYESVR